MTRYSRKTTDAMAANRVLWAAGMSVGTSHELGNQRPSFAKYEERLLVGPLELPVS